MALKGNLREFSITQLLNLINLARKTGTLVVDGHNEAARVIFREGKLAFATLGKNDNGLADILYRGKKISVGQLRIIKERASRMSDKELGLLLINAGYMSQDDILSSLQQYMVDIVRSLYNWADGIFHFENELLIPEDKIAVRVDLENLIIEGARQMREREQLQEEIPSLDMALKFTDRPGTNMRNINLSVEEWRVVSYINPKNSIRQIAHATKLSDLEIRRVIYSLLQAGLVEVARPEGASVAVIGRPVFQTGNKEEQKSLISRLISRIRSL